MKTSANELTAKMIKDDLKKLFPIGVIAMRQCIDLDKTAETDYYQSIDDSAYEFHRICGQTVQVYYLGNKIGVLNINRGNGSLKKYGDEYLKQCKLVDLFFNDYLENKV